MKIFNSVKEITEYLGINEAYWHQEISNFLSSQGSETFDSKEDIEKVGFKYNGFMMETEKGNVEVFIASIQTDNPVVEFYEYYYCIE